MKYLKHNNHSYYCNFGNFFQNDVGATFSSWKRFYNEWGNADKDFNLLVRWDYYDYSCDEYTDEEPEKPFMEFHYIIQRKGYKLSVKVYVTPEDEEDILKYIRDHWAFLQKVWEI